MFDVRKVRPRHHFHYFLMLLFALSILATAQDKDDDKNKDKDQDKNKAVASGAHLVKVEGKVRCDKPDPAYSIEVPDRPGHALRLAKRKCTWIEPMVVLGAKSKNGVAVEFPEQMEGILPMVLKWTPTTTASS